jgi:hypothetical protein
MTSFPGLQLLMCETDGPLAPCFCSTYAVQGSPDKHVLGIPDHYLHGFGFVLVLLILLVGGGVLVVVMVVVMVQVLENIKLAGKRNIGNLIIKIQPIGIKARLARAAGHGSSVVAAVDLLESADVAGIPILGVAQARRR